MQKLLPVRFGIAIGIVGAAFYIGYVIFMAVAPAETVVWFSNSLLHGVDVKSIMRESIPIEQSIVGVVGTFVGGWIFGTVTASLYNVGLQINKVES